MAGVIAGSSRLMGNASIVRIGEWKRSPAAGKNRYPRTENLSLASVAHPAFELRGSIQVSPAILQRRVRRGSLDAADGKRCALPSPDRHAVRLRRGISC